LRWPAALPASQPGGDQNAIAAGGMRTYDARRFLLTKTAG